MAAITNISQFLPEVAQRFADRPAIYCVAGRNPDGSLRYDHITFKELEDLSNLYAEAFRSHGITKGTKTLVFLRPGFDFIATVFAVFKTGAVPVLIDPGMGRDNLLNCIRSTAPEAMIAVSKAHWIRLLFRSSFKSIKTHFSLGILPPLGVIRMEGIKRNPAPKDFQIVETALEDEAAILFTTGSTGPPKGVIYTHEIFVSQVKIITETYGSGPEEMDMPCFPLFALFSAAMGMSCVIPEMDPTRPASVDPRNIIDAVTTHKVSFSFGSPALWRTVATYCDKHNVKLPTLKKVLMAGAPVPGELHRLVLGMTDNQGETMVPYGATESLPIATFTGNEVLAETAELTSIGKGYCVGYPLDAVTIRVIRAIDDAIPEWSDDLVVPDGDIGEIAIRGPVVTPAYFNKPDATAKAKIRDKDGKLWHRMGDVGYFDAKGRLWFCGRKTHRVITAERIFYPVNCEAIFNAHAKVFRSALVGVTENGKIKPVIIIEPIPEAFPQSEMGRTQFTEELLEMGKTHDFTEPITTFLFHKSFPVDIRHNAKIFREKLSVWAQEQLRS